MDKKSSMDKQRKSTVAFKRRRSQLHKNQISETSKNEAKEGTMYDSGIGLNLNSSATAMEVNNSELSINELYGINAAIRVLPKFWSRRRITWSSRQRNL